MNASLTKENRNREKTVEKMKLKESERVQEHSLFLSEFMRMKGILEVPKIDKTAQVEILSSQNAPMSKLDRKIMA